MRFSALIVIILTTILSRSAIAQTVNQFNLLQGKKKVTIPFTYVNNFIILDVKIYGIIPLHLIFDTGAEHVIIFKRQYTNLIFFPGFF